MEERKDKIMLMDRNKIFAQWIFILCVNIQFRAVRALYTVSEMFYSSLICQKWNGWTRSSAI